MWDYWLAFEHLRMDNHAHSLEVVSLKIAHRRKESFSRQTFWWTGNNRIWENIQFGNIAKKLWNILWNEPEIMMKSVLVKTNKKKILQQFYPTVSSALCNHNLPRLYQFHSLWKSKKAAYKFLSLMCCTEFLSVNQQVWQTHLQHSTQYKLTISADSLSKRLTKTNKAYKVGFIVHTWSEITMQMLTWNELIYSHEQPIVKHFRCFLLSRRVENGTNRDFFVSELSTLVQTNIWKPQVVNIQYQKTNRLSKACRWNSLVCFTITVMNAPRSQWLVLYLRCLNFIILSTSCVAASLLSLSFLICL